MMKDFFTGSTLLITGGTGSFGKTVIRSLINTGIKEVRIFSRDEKKQHDLRKLYNNSKLKFYIGDVRDLKSTDYAMGDVDFVFHAAALKQVPSCEFFPLEATKTNVLGTANVIKSAISNHVKKVVCLSTDKAAYPINAMGISKALMEKVAIAESRNIPANGPIVTVTRYGNVMASRGSVIPLFISQIKANQPLTITNGAMSRFLMSLDEAMHLVLFAFQNGKQGDLFVQKSPASSVLDLATAIKRLFNSNVDIRTIGTRHGEKLYETLLTKEEFAKAEDLGDYYRVPADNRDLNYGKFYEQGDENLSEEKEYHSHNARQLNIDEIIEKLLELSYVNDIVELKRNSHA